MLLLQRNINQTENAAVLVNVKNQVDEDCKKINSKIVINVPLVDNSTSIYIAKSIEPALLNENIEKIVKEFYTGSLEHTVQLFKYLEGLPNSTDCVMINAIYKT